MKLQSREVDATRHTKVGVASSYDVFISPVPIRELSCKDLLSLQDLFTQIAAFPTVFYDTASLLCSAPVDWTSHFTRHPRHEDGNLEQAARNNMA